MRMVWGRDGMGMPGMLIGMGLNVLLGEWGRRCGL